MVSYKDLSKEEYLLLSEEIKEEVIKGVKTAVLVVGYGGEKFFNDYLEGHFEKVGIDFLPYTIFQSDKKDEEGYRKSWLTKEIPPYLKKALVVERTAETGGSLLSADIYLLEKIKEGKLNFEEIINLAAKDEADFAHIQVVGIDKYGEKDGRTIFVEALKEMFPKKYEELKSGEEDIFSRISDMPHMRFRTDEREINKDRRQIIEALLTLGTLSLLFGGKKK